MCWIMLAQYSPVVIWLTKTRRFNMVANVKNKWLTNVKNLQLMDDLDEHLMNARASDATVGEFLNSLPDNIKKVFLGLTLNVPSRTEEGFEIALNVPSK